MNRRLGICLLGLVAVTVVYGVTVVGVAAQEPVGPSPAGPTDAEAPLTAPNEFDTTVFRIQIYENQSARWTIEYARPLANQSEIDSFDAYANRFNGEETKLYTDFRTRARQIVGTGSEVTDRPMNATAFDGVAERSDRPSDFSQPRGLVRLSFTWTNFAQADGDRVVVSDVFPGGMYVGGNQRLEFRRGPNLAFVAVQPDPDSVSDQGNLTTSTSVTWIGERQFADERPYAAFEPRSAVGGDGAGDGGGGSGGEADGSSADGAPGQSDTDEMVPMVLAGAALLLAVAGGVAWHRGYLPPGERESTPEPSTRAESDPAGDGAGATAGVESGGSGAAATQLSEEELLSDEDRVLQLLDENGGRMKQVAIVEETDWSKSKVSMLLSDMEEDGEISKLRLGRENIISLAGQEPDAAGSPFDDE